MTPPDTAKSTGPANRDDLVSKAEKSYGTQKYWRERSDFIYYDYIDYIVRTVACDAKSMIDVGSGNCPYLDWFHWIPERVSVDIRVPYASEHVKGIKGDIHELQFDHKFDVCSCFQVLEHVPDATRFARRLLELAPLVLVSVPYNWPTKPPTTGHVHDPVDYEKLTGWMGREANYHIIVQEPFPGKYTQRLIAIYAEDQALRYTREVVARRIMR